MSFSLSLIFFVALDFPGLMITCCLISRSRCVTECCVYTGLWRPVRSWALSQAPSGNSLIVWLEGPRVDTYTMMRVTRPIFIEGNICYIQGCWKKRFHWSRRTIEFTLNMCQYRQGCQGDMMRIYLLIYWQIWNLFFILILRDLIFFWVVKYFGELLFFGIQYFLEN